ncbi:Gfo/Idh/MocA family protein [Salsipaludibacter albus]|uniref:Gfo/Idh/MocA family protein n=1 Tax=Salsipaludibacter albus TaxID=2849650 RepID=UPI001EE43444|nr:Gfo/Idh/MocA family oxidoreductase [Salsipaludibacter albus]MBY5162011.1 Gfo/Idh/MocA family oxidoreductase [Salsipaludibacter albus]
MTEYGWGIIGAGRISREFAADLGNVPDGHLVAVGSRSPDHAAAYAEEVGAARGHGSYEDLVADADVDVVYVGNDHLDHVGAARLAVEAGKPVLVEKPLGTDREQVAELLRLAVERRVFVMEAMWSRFLPGLTELIARVADGAIGTVRTAQLDLGIDQPDPESRLFDPARAGGALLDVGVYPISIARMVLGGLADVRASARMGGGVDLATDMWAVTSDGARVRLRCAVDEPLANTATFVGDAGRIQVDQPLHHPGRFTVEDLAGEVEVVETPFAGHGFEFEIVEVHECLAQGLVQSPRWSHGDTLATHAVMDEVRRQIGLVYPFEDGPPA